MLNIQQEIFDIYCFFNISFIHPLIYPSSISWCKTDSGAITINNIQFQFQSLISLEWMYRLFIAIAMLPNNHLQNPWWRTTIIIYFCSLLYRSAGSFADPSQDLLLSAGISYVFVVTWQGKSCSKMTLGWTVCPHILSSLILQQTSLGWLL